MLASAGAGLLLDLAAYSTDTEGNAAQHYPAYAFAHPPLFTEGMRMYSDYRRCGFILDRGYFSRANIAYMDADYVKKAARDLGRELESIRKGA